MRATTRGLSPRISRTVGPQAPLIAAGLLAMLGLTIGAGPPAQAAPAEPSARPFAPGSFVNEELRQNAPIDARSAAYVQEFRRQVRAYGPWINVGKYSTPVYVVKKDQPTVRVTPGTAYQPLHEGWREVPLPRKARAAAGTDKHLVVWQPSTDTMWEFWLLRRNSGGWHARWGGRMTGVSKNPGYFNLVDPPSAGDRGSGATASGIPLLAGLIRGSDLGPGGIRHGLALALPETRPNEWIWPAHRTDGFYWTKGVAQIPEGARFRLDPDLDIEALDISPTAKLFARALQRYGMVVRDKSGAVTFYAEDPRTGGGRMERVLFGNGTPNQSPSNYLREDYGKFPWHRLQLLKMGPSSDWSVYRP